MPAIATRLWKPLVALLAAATLAGCVTHARVQGGGQYSRHGHGHDEGRHQSHGDRYSHRGDRWLPDGRRHNRYERERRRDDHHRAERRRDRAERERRRDDRDRPVLGQRRADGPEQRRLRRAERETRERREAEISKTYPGRKVKRIQGSPLKAG